MKVHLVSLGCARTLVDSEVALGSLKTQGHQIVQDLNRADVAVVNTCGFIQEAKMESIETILELCERKKKGKLRAVVVLGCLAQRHGEELKKELGGEVDGIIGTDSYGNIAELLKPLEKKHSPVYEIKAKPRYILDENTPRVYLTPAHYAYVKISEGCLNACSYCVIPKMKGPHRSRPVESILNEIKKITSERKISEINLIGQDTAAFGYDADRKFRLAELLNAIGKLNAAPWVRLLYAHPGHVTDEIINALAQNANICKYVDFPIEHSHDAMLLRMNRGVDRKKMDWGIRELRRRIPNVAIRTTVIVGFPGETEEEFEDLLDYLKEHRFEKLGAFMFSQEEGSRAFDMPDQIPDELKRERFDAVMGLQQQISGEIQSRLVGKTLRVLIDEKGKKANSYVGRTEADAPEVDGHVQVFSVKTLEPGQFADVLIRSADDYDLSGAAVL